LQKHKAETGQKMATAKNKGDAPGRGREVIGIGLLGLGVFCMVSLVSMQAGRGHLMGPGGAAAATALYSLIGLCAYPVVAGVLLLAVRMCRARRLIDDVVNVLGFVGLLCSVAVILYLPFAGDRVTLRGPGGLLGQWLAEGVAGVVGGVGAAMAAGTLLSISLILLTHVSVGQVFAALVWAARSAGHVVRVAACAAAWLAVKGVRALGRVVSAMFPEKEEASGTENSDPGEAEPAWDAISDRDEPFAALPAPAESLREGDSDVNEPGGFGSTIDFAEPSQDVNALLDEAPIVHENEATSGDGGPGRRGGRGRVRGPGPAQGRAHGAIGRDEARAEHCPGGDRGVGRRRNREERGVVRQASGAGPIIVQPVIRRETGEQPACQAADEGDGLGYVRLSDGAFQLPGTDLLEYSPPEGGAIDEKTLKAMAARLEQAMGNYGVRGNVTAIQMGPVITTFEFAPVPGTRTGKIVQLENDLAMALEAQSVRIVAPSRARPWWAWRSRTRTARWSISRKSSRTIPSARPARSCRSAWARTPRAHRSA
jgi:hypothetical protein